MPEQTSGKNREPSDMLRGRTVLLVDDDSDFRQSLALQLAFFGCSVEQTGNGETGIAMAAAAAPDVILLDLNMPGMQGDEVCARLRADIQSAAIPIIIITGEEQHDAIIKSLEAGANDVLRKPINPMELMVKIRNLVSLRLVEELKIEQNMMQDTIAAVGQAKREWETTMDCVADVIILTDRQDRIIRCNRAMTDLAGMPFERLLGKRWQPVLAEAGFVCSVSEQAEIEYLTPCGTVYDLSVSYVPRAAGLPAAVIRLLDVTAIREAQKSLEESHRLLSEQNSALECANAELQSMQFQMIQQEKMSSIGQLAAGVAHEINNPIGFISSNLSTLRRYAEWLKAYIAAVDACIEELPDDARRRLAAARRENKIDYLVPDIEALVHESLDGAERVKSIVKDLKSFSRVDETESKAADINAGIDSTINIVWSELKYKATVERDFGKLPQTLCNLGQLNQVFMNMLVNAAHAMETQGRITVKTWADTHDIFVQIADTGSGIPADKLQKIFEPFFTTKEVGKGTGLGLSIAYDIVKRHNGDIQVQSEPGKGTAFTIRIPIVPST
ncbi:MAG TPA: ATP-binding protein [Dissulfurispiraceae bacterium]|nr:ATP-binding protein [Dissulfurispiraceae bacterium]